MGIKGTFKELGPGKRVSLAKLSADCIAAHGRPLRIAVDFAIWQFQNKAARGGSNADIRTLFYRLARLLGTPVQPIFVFDGPEKPTFKRNKRSGRGDAVATAQAKRLISCFGFPIHNAPGEAEAECAFLQSHGIVDAVLSEDVDTIMFGCTKTLRNWSSERKSSKVPTHVSLYDVDDEDLNIAGLGLGREGLVLVALMSGGDYLPEGIPGCGVKVALEAAKAGFGKSLCRLRASDKKGLQDWRASLTHELHTNEQGFFKTRHKAYTIPDDFPDMAILRYYTHPVVSPESSLDVVKQKMEQARDVSLVDLREFSRETFDWDFKIGAIKFIRVLSQPLLVHKIRRGESGIEKLVTKITSRRAALSTDLTPELRLSFTPHEVVPIDLSQEVDETLAYSRQGLALNSDDEFEPPSDGPSSSQVSKSVPSKTFDISKPDLAWVLESLVKDNLPDAVAAWEEAEAAKAMQKSPKKKKTDSKKTKKIAGGMSQGALDQYVRVERLASKDTRTSKVKARQRGSSPERKAPYRHQTLPHRLSKPSQPSAAAGGSPLKRATEGIPASSHVPPRIPANATAGPETIIISSSPAAGPASSPLLSPSPTPRQPPFSSIDDAPSSVCSILAAGARKAVGGGLKGAKELKTSQNAAGNKASSTIAQGRKMKQTSMDMFAKRLFPPPATQTASLPPLLPTNASTQHWTEVVDLAEEASSSDLEPLSSLTAPRSTQPRSLHKRNKSQAASSQASDSPAHRAQPKKTLLGPRIRSGDFFDESEGENETLYETAQREHRSLYTRSLKHTDIDWSDGSVVDLTQDDA